MLRTEHEKRITVIVGLGLTGYSCARYLLGQGESIKVVDSRINPPALDQLKELDDDIEIELGVFKAETFEKAKRIVVSPGVDLREPVIQKAVKKGVPVLGDVEIFSKNTSTPIVAVTGSNAKSTVVTLLGEMAKEEGVNAAVAGNIGEPVLDFLNGENKSLYVIELSSFQLDSTVSLGAKVAAILNISMDHMDRYSSMKEYVTSKQKIFQGCEKLVFNRDDAMTFPLPGYSGELLSYGLDVPKEGEFGCKVIDEDNWLMCGDKQLMMTKELKLVGQHNVTNALASLAIGAASGFGVSSMIKTLKKFAGLKHRCQWVANVEGIDYVNDSKGTNTGACIAAINGLSKRGEIVLLVGGQSKGADLNTLRDSVEAFVKHVIVFGEDADLFIKALKGVAPISKGKTFKKAFKKAVSEAEAGNVVLLSPACSSFDMFQDYQQRGEAFEELVKGLAA